MFMLEKSEQIQHQLKLNAKRKNKSMKVLISKNYRMTRTPSKEFNDPIYAGFDVNQQNKQLAQWGPWIGNSDSPLKNSYSLHTNLKKGLAKQLSNQDTLNLKKNLLTSPALIMPRSSSKNQLPEIKQATISREKRLQKVEHLDKKALQKVDLKFNPKGKPGKYAKNNPYKPLQYNKNRIRLGTVVYNYCTNYNLDECILNYNRKSEPVLQKIIRKQDLMLTKLQGFKTYWMRKNQNAGGTQE